MELIFPLATLNDVEIEDQFISSETNIAAPQHPTPDDPPWGLFEGIALWAASVLAILLIPGLFLLPYLTRLDPPITQTDALIEFAKTDPTSIFIQIAAIIPAHILTLLMAWLIVTRMRKFSFPRTLGWDNGGFRWWYYVVILSIFFAIAALVGNFFPEQENDLTRMLQSSRSVVYIVAFIATFTAPIVEEVVYRGVLYSAFQRVLGVPTAFVIVTFMFAVVHVPQYYPSFPTIFLLTLLSLILTGIRVRTGNLLPCIILHTVFNALQSVFLLLEPVITKSGSTDNAATFLHLLKY